MDERAICRDAKLAELDQALSIAYSQAHAQFRQDAELLAKSTLEGRRQCGGDRLCILDQQINAIEIFSGLGSKVPVPPWVRDYRIKLFREL